jgi:hypothetical protein
MRGRGEIFIYNNYKKRFSITLKSGADFGKIILVEQHKKCIVYRGGNHAWQHVW